MRHFADVALHVTIDPSKRVIMMRGSGKLTDADLAQAGKQCEADPAADPSFYRICDLSEVTGINVSDQALDAWVSSPVSNPAVPHAIICNAPPVLQRVLDYVKLSREQFGEVSVLPSYEQAAQWLRQRQMA